MHNRAIAGILSKLPTCLEIQGQTGRSPMCPHIVPWVLRPTSDSKDQ
jgi:hypothetical protein